MQASATTLDRSATLAKRLPFYSLLVSTSISGIGSTMTAIAIPWFVLQTTGSAGLAGITGAVEAIPVVLAGVFGGTIVDRLGFRRASILSDIASGVTVAMIPLLYFTIGLEFWELLVVTFLARLFLTPGMTGRRSIVPALARHAGLPLARANSIYEVASRSSLMVGPPLAGILIAFIGAAPVLWIDAGTYAISALMMTVAVPAALATVVQDHEDEEVTQSYFAELRAGLSWIRNQRLLRSLITSVLISNLIEAPWIIAMTVYARDVLDSSVSLGLLFSAVGAGTIIGAIGYGFVEEHIPRRWIFPIGFGSMILEFSLLIAQAPMVWLVAAMFCIGLVVAPINPMFNTVVQERTPNRMLGRVFGLISALAMAAQPIGYVLGGGIIEAASLNTLLVIQASALAVLVLWQIFSPSFRALDARAPEAAGVT